MKEVKEVNEVKEVASDSNLLAAPGIPSLLYSCVLGYDGNYTHRCGAGHPQRWDT